MARFGGKKERLETTIPTSSMADIAFLLLIFFMVTTVFIRFRPDVPPELPEAEAVQGLQNTRPVTNLWIAPDGAIQIDSLSGVPLDKLAPLMLSKIRRNPRLIVLIKSDESTSYGRVSDVIEELRRAEALRITFAATPEGI